MAAAGQKLTSDYVAGVVDSDGCIRWSKGTPYVTVVGVFAPLMEQMQRQFGGGIYRVGCCNHHDDRPVWRWQVTGNNAMAVLHFIRSQLFEKRPQAELVFAMRKLRPGPKRASLERQLSALKQTHYHLTEEAT